MKTIYFVVLACLATASCNNDANDAALLAEGNSKFTAKMFAEVSNKNPRKSFVLSAFSVLTPLAQLSLAAEGNSHDELLRAIGLPNDETTKTAFRQVDSNLRSVKGVDLKMANRIYVANGYTLNKDYEEVVKQTFQSEVKNVDFTASQSTAKEINTWVEQQTNNRIKDLVDPNTLDADTRAVLVNAIYFKGTWKDQFEKKRTSENDFYLSHRKKIKVSTMYRKGDYNYGESAELNAKILELPYVGDESAFYIILPNNVVGISELLDRVKDSSSLERALNSLYEIEVEAYIPKFKIETTTNLKEILPEIGVKGIFDASKAKLNRLLTNESDLYISDAIQKAFIEINEEGAEAAAANAFIITESYTQPMIFAANRPFIFAIKVYNNIIFNGVYSPSLVEDKEE
ncbi:PREDICTED: antichymotrypsin-2-like isoform X1 [Papilio xuthus]|uniref:Antichymotrypsin-2-like isoform X1 n=1 Tax=Papilio xuthus TaxID=66420 RepID=A0AAJ6ZSD1_PAPXU|nr:PREDICTED: antichymotrypsin-2-like isoform X1 [Papilio xuthus]